MSGLDDLKSLVKYCNAEIRLREESIREEGLYGPTLAQEKSDYESQQDYEEELSQAFVQYAELFNTIRTELYSGEKTTDGLEIHGDTQAFMEVTAVEIKDMPSLQPFLDYTNALQRGDDVDIDRATSVEGAFAVTKFFDRCLIETDKFRYEDTTTYGMNSDGASVADDVAQRLAAYAALSLSSER